MRAFLNILGTIFAIIILAVAGTTGYGYLLYRDAGGSNMSKETLKVAIESIIAVSNSWDTSEMERRSHPELLEEMQKAGQSFEEISNVYRNLGNLKGDVTCTQVNMKVVWQPEKYMVVDYACNAIYENSVAKIFIELRKDNGANGSWLIRVFRIDSPLFTKLLEK